MATRTIVSERRGSLSLLAAGGIAVWALSLGAFVWPTSAADAVTRIVATAFALLVSACVFRQETRFFLVSPVYLLGLLTLVFYVLAPALHVSVASNIESFLGITIYPPTHGRTVLYVGSQGEALILQFSVMCFALTALLLRFAPPKRIWKLSDSGRWRNISYTAPALALAIVSPLIIGHWLPSARSAFGAGLAGQLHHALAPVMSLLLATMAYAAAFRGRRFRAATLLVAAVTLSAVIVAEGLAFTPVYMALAALLIFILAGGIKPGKLAFAASLIVGAVLAAIVGTTLLREYTAVHRTTIKTPEIVWQALFAKLVLRQGVSGNCLDRVLQNHLGAEGGGTFYFLIAPVPRMLWPEKPSLSRGAEFAERYCDQPGAVKGRHSESFTLLGEPLLEGGFAGLIVAQIFIGVVLVAITVAGTSGNPLLLIVMTAMLPWLATFQPGFAQYVGNMVKMFLFMSPLIAALAWCIQQQRSRSVTVE